MIALKLPMRALFFCVKYIARYNCLEVYTPRGPILGFSGDNGISQSESFTEAKIRAPKGLFTANSGTQTGLSSSEIYSMQSDVGALAFENKHLKKQIDGIIEVGGKVSSENNNLRDRLDDMEVQFSNQAQEYETSLSEHKANNLQTSRYREDNLIREHEAAMGKMNTTIAEGRQATLEAIAAKEAMESRMAINGSELDARAARITDLSRAKSSLESQVQSMGQIQPRLQAVKKQAGALNQEVQSLKYATDTNKAMFKNAFSQAKNDMGYMIKRYARSPGKRRKLTLSGVIEDTTVLSEPPKIPAPPPPLAATTSTGTGPGPMTFDDLSQMQTDASDKPIFSEGKRIDDMKAAHSREMDTMRSDFHTRMDQKDTLHQNALMKKETEHAQKINDLGVGHNTDRLAWEQEYKDMATQHALDQLETKTTEALKLKALQQEYDTFKTDQTRVVDDANHNKTAGIAQEKQRGETERQKLVETHEKTVADLKTKHATDLQTTKEGLNKELDDLKLKGNKGEVDLTNKEIDIKNKWAEKETQLKDAHAVDIVMSSTITQ